MEILRETFFVQGLAAALIIGIVSKIMVWKSYHNLLIASEEMDRPQRRWIGVLKKKFENYYQLDADVHNTGCIVDQYFENHRLLGISITVWEQIPGLCAILCMMLGCAGAARGIAQGTDIFLWLMSLMLSAVAGFLIFMIDSLFQMEHMKRMIRTNLINYLENVLPNRVNKSMKKKEKDVRRQKKNQENLEKEEEEAGKIAGHWEQIASARELELTPEDIQTLKDFISEL